MVLMRPGHFPIVVMISMKALIQADEVEDELVYSLEPHLSRE